MLTITDVTRKRFAEARLHEGYEMTEVDRFMAEVAEALYARDEKIDQLHREMTALQQATHSTNGAGGAHAAPHNGASNGSHEAAVTGASNGGPVTATAMLVDPGTGLPSGDGATVHETSAAAIRLLEIAGTQAQQIVSEARSEAMALLDAARVAADELTTSSREEADRLRSELAQQRTEQAAELEERRATVLAALADQEGALERRIQELRDLEGRHLADLQGYFSEQIAQLQARASLVAQGLGGGAAPRS